jgi:hypothetical protein
MLVYALVVVGWYSRVLEHDADVDACLNREKRMDSALAADFCSALQSLSTGVVESRFSQWLHPPMDKRVTLVQRLLERPWELSKTRACVPFMAAALAVLYLAAGLLAVLAS